MARLSGGSFRKILEIGCGTGIHTALLLSTFSDAFIFAVDIAPAMIDVAREKFGATDRVRFVVEDGETLADRHSGRFDLITANGAFQWFSDLPAALSSLRRLLRPGGRIHFSLFGRRTFLELQDVLCSILPADPVIPAASFPDLATMNLILAPIFEGVCVEEVAIVRFYPDLMGFLRTLKLTGVVPGPGRMRLHPSLVTRMDELYRKRWGGIRATYRVLLCSARKGGVEMP